MQGEKTSSFSACDAVQARWDFFIEGVDFFHGKIESPRIEFWVLKIDLSAPGIEVVVGGDALNAKVSSFVRGNNLTAGINATPFDIVSSKEGQPVKNTGLVVSNGVLLSPANPRYDALVFYKGGSAAVVSQASFQLTENTVNAAGGFHKILVSGEPAERTQSREERHPRSAAGISANGAVLYLLAIDGRRALSIGATEKETALLLRALGAEEGLNLDGGGSTALALRGKEGKVTVLNKPVHNGIPGTERPVAACIGIYIKE